MGKDSTKKEKIEPAVDFTGFAATIRPTKSMFRPVVLCIENGCVTSVSYGEIDVRAIAIERALRTLEEVE